MIKIYRLMFYICLIAIEFLATTSVHISVVENMWDKSNHFFAFFVLYVLLSFSYSLCTKVKVFWLILFAIQIEIVQYFLPNRYFSLLDILADSIGLVLGLLAYTLLKNIKFLRG